MKMDNLCYELRKNDFFGMRSFLNELRKPIKLFALQIQQLTHRRKGKSIYDYYVT